MLAHAHALLHLLAKPDAREKEADMIRVEFLSVIYANQVNILCK